ncbi:hypothetical protein BDN67DRAFT_1026783 [Paxillus ammoniavirescens]|nr:hypothetical protein BDN67DRAFT_1026783 [Paxillus ammoniavirescens]
MQVGVHTKKVCDFMGFQDGQYCIIRRSNTRYDIQLIFRTLRSGVHGIQFHGLDWILTQRTRIALIFCGTIDFGFRVDSYLFHNAGGDLVSRMKRIRMFNALNWKSYNDETLRFWRENDPDVQIIVATSILSVGIDAPKFDGVVILGEPDVDEYVLARARSHPSTDSRSKRSRYSVLD